MLKADFKPTLGFHLVGFTTGPKGSKEETGRRREES
jgi:hypothetical protein